LLLRFDDHNEVERTSRASNVEHHFPMEIEPNRTILCEDGRVWVCLCDCIVSQKDATILT